METSDEVDNDADTLPESESYFYSSSTYLLSAIL